MIHIIASLTIKDGKISKMKQIYKSFVPKVEAEEGCIMYCPTVDFETDIPTQEKNKNIIIVIEKWENIEAFKAHLSVPHLAEFRKDAKGLIEGVSIKVQQNLL